jgi:cytosine/adenosine deaminase-related metal-dependent hydrolase
VNACDLLVVRGHVLTMDAARTEHADGAVAIAGGAIVDVGASDELSARWDAAQVLDAGGGVIHPGFIDVHSHILLACTRGVFAEDLDPAAYTEVVRQWFELLDEAGERAQTLMGCLEMARNGITYFVEPGSVVSLGTVAEAVREIGIRGSLADAWLTGGEAGVGDVPARAHASLRASLDELGTAARTFADPSDLVTGHVALWAGSPDELLVAAHSTARSLGVIATQHQSYGDDAAEDDARLGCHPLVHWERLGILDETWLLSHMNIVREDELAAVARTGVGVAWCPTTFLNRGGAQRFKCSLPDLADAGAVVGIGADSPYFGFDSMAFLAYLVARARGSRPVTADELLAMVTIEGARAAGVDDRLGSLEVGKRADLVLRATDVPEAHPAPALAQTLLLSLRSKGVDTVIVDGRVIVRGGHHTSVDEREVFALAAESARATMAQIV